MAECFKWLSHLVLYDVKLHRRAEKYAHKLSEQLLEHDLVIRLPLLHNWNVRRKTTFTETHAVLLMENQLNQVHSRDGVNGARYCSHSSANVHCLPTWQLQINQYEFEWRTFVMYKFHAYSVNKKLFLTTANVRGLSDVATTNACKLDTSNRNHIERSKWMKWLITGLIGGRFEYITKVHA